MGAEPTSIWVGWRLRLSSTEPSETEGDWLTLGEDQDVCRHLPLPLWSGREATLRRMGRRFSAAQCHAVVDRARAAVAGLAVTVDLISGFPGETEDECARSPDLAQSMEFVRRHVFPYSHVAERVPPGSRTRYRIQCRGNVTDA